jgi:hypothetical protein
MNVRLLRDEGDTVIVGWDPIPEAVGYRFVFKSDKSVTMNPLIRRIATLPACNTRVAKAELPVMVIALMPGEEDTYPDAVGSWPPKETAPPPFEPLRTFEVGNAAEMAQARTQLRAGDRIEGGGFTMPNQIRFHDRLNGPAEIRLNDIKLTGGEAYDLNAAWLWSRNLRVFGGLLSNPNGHGLLVYESDDSGWWDFKVDGVGGSCLRTFTPNGNGTRLTLVGEVTDNAHLLTLDPHEDKGSGLHPSYIGGNNPAGYRQRDSMFAIWAHDCAGGSNQIGPGERNRHWYRANDLTYEEHAPNFQVGGNAVQPFGDVIDAEIWVEANNVSRMCDPRWLGPGARNVKLIHGRGGSTARLMPRYIPHAAVTYTDCQ